ncbi:hypothetical protein SAMN05877753_106154 [Bacillus oleivorans]|uniref:Uncharacterized protein n=1 Tax=Bacillus oleivorans TaxID=1448271 RepID=A0A285CYL6_9BACI|nr:hypothetical protein [Bacillus oleivorans]SNX72640.1 hypothetical protein SAMN05877753_106154 [Bacillus oleivorans]
MVINDTTSTFFHLINKHDTLMLNHLEDYYQTYPEVFAEYFPHHCPKTPERLTAAIEKYPTQLEELKKVADRLPPIIETALNSGRLELIINRNNFIFTLASLFWLKHCIHHLFYFLLFELKNCIDTALLIGAEGAKTPAGVRGKGDPAGAKAPRRLPGTPAESEASGAQINTLFHNLKTL